MIIALECKITWDIPLHLFRVERLTPYITEPLYNVEPDQTAQLRELIRALMTTFQPSLMCV